MTIRDRQEDLRSWMYGTMYIKFYNRTWNRQVKFGQWGTCRDVNDNKGEDNPFERFIYEQEYPVLNGTVRDSGGNVTHNWSNYPIEYNAIPVNARDFYNQKYGNPVLRTDEIARDVAVRTTPSREYLSTPTSGIELRDLPSMVREFGRRILDDLKRLKGGRAVFSTARMIGERNALIRAVGAVGAGHLAWRFALAPVLSDLRKLLQFQRLAEKRFRYLRHLNEGKWVRRRVILNKSADRTVGGLTNLQSLGVSVTAQRHTDYRCLEWATTRWKLLEKYTEPGVVWNDYVLRQKAFNVIFGLNSYQAVQSSWELLPWSWLVDWFVPVGDFLTVMNNSIPCVQDKVCYMRTTSSQTSYAKYTVSRPEVTISGPHWESFVGKERIVISPWAALLPIPRLPFLSNGQMSILGSLAAVKLQKFF